MFYSMENGKSLESVKQRRGMILFIFSQVPLAAVWIGVDEEQKAGQVGGCCQWSQFG